MFTQNGKPLTIYFFPRALINQIKIQTSYHHNIYIISIIIIINVTIIIVIIIINVTHK